MIKTHTTVQPDSEITAFFLSCNRLDLLQEAIQSFLHTRDTVTKIVILDDSGVSSVFETLVEAYGDIADIICFPRNRGIFWAKDFMVSYCDTKYIFYVEDDWKFINTGYLTISKSILEKYREIGSVDLSWRTFEEQGFDSYDPELIDNQFYYKKPWRISSNHFHWFIWHGSPNLKRREDLILLGRTENCPNEWSIDRKFFSLGYKGVFLNQRYVYHLGDHRSIMVNKRHQESETPETLYPEALKKNRYMPILDYHALDQTALAMRGNLPDMRNNSVVLVTALMDINRETYDTRNFENHYVNGFYKLIKTGMPVFAFVDDRYYEALLKTTGGLPVGLWPINLQAITKQTYFEKIKAICENPEWYTQASWMANSVIRSPLYIALTHMKLSFLKTAIDFNAFNADNFLWIDSGICNSFGISDIGVYDFHKMPFGADNVLITRFPYYPNPEIHGFNKQGYNEMCGAVPPYVYRATLFGGNKTAISKLITKYSEFLNTALDKGYLGTEEAIFSGLALTHPELFHHTSLPDGDIKHFLALLARSYATTNLTAK